ncbi:MAG: hypothetical protein BWY92_01851 [Firmicutes bacterium ADurb.BinA052]|nr:MAG: hypothetical protein BWY92_01851 [Firmicutes bacterium ADurb.BinA052]
MAVTIDCNPPTKVLNHEARRPISSFEVTSSRRVRSPSPSAMSRTICATLSKGFTVLAASSADMATVHTNTTATVAMA